MDLKCTYIKKNRLNEFYNLTIMFILLFRIQIVN